MGICKDGLCVMLFVRDWNPFVWDCIVNFLVLCCFKSRTLVEKGQKSS